MKIMLLLVAMLSTSVFAKSQYLDVHTIDNNTNVEIKFPDLKHDKEISSYFVEYYPDGFFDWPVPEYATKCSYEGLVYNCIYTNGYMQPGVGYTVKIHAYNNDELIGSSELFISNTFKPNQKVMFIFADTEEDKSRAEPVTDYF